MMRSTLEESLKYREHRVRKMEMMHVLYIYTCLVLGEVGYDP
jgi:hypothetical protein